MILLLAFFFSQLPISDLIKGFVSVNEVYAIFLLLISILAIALYLYRSLYKEWLVLIFTGVRVQTLLLFNGLYVLMFPVFSNGTDTGYFNEFLSAISSGSILMLLIAFALVNSKQLLNLDTQRWRPEEREKFT
ncbi:hypothetical protein [Planomicrobium sp. CPCC 101079]|uniref:hypothetical protein n=1 Tax=Planomicrobium sp. CPCC 101079 TaxID=2599618 RepID=UPI0011B800FA|nr:hypothetical protein [Planomicrobium sp. CPCC 101079]TWT03729.1 hypothetical protein FQV28_11985 [Planomicrobium sp. CPCC 101079]